jgi:transitional endoplasmic reticulum ATPase
MTVEVNPQQVIARVKHVDSEHLLAYLEFRNGNILAHRMDESDDFSSGDVVLVGPAWDDVEKAPSELWYDEPWIGIVRLILPDEVVVAVGDRVRAFHRPESLDIKEGSTVEGLDSQGILRVLSDRPIRQIEISIGDPINPELFKSQPSGSPSFEDFGGYDDIIARVQELIEVPLRHRGALVKINARPIKGVLFTGDSGTGKTMMARIIANQAGAQFYKISGPEIISKWVGQSEEVIREIFDDATKQERAIIFFDEIDSVAPQRGDESNEASRRIVGQLLTLMDGFSKESNVVVIATTNRPQDIDLALRRPGRFDWEIEFPLPSQKDREAILVTSALKLSIEDDLPHYLIAEKTDLWSPADLTAIWSEAALMAVQDNREMILEEDYFGGFERVAAQRVRVAASKQDGSKERVR